MATAPRTLGLSQGDGDTEPGLQVRRLSRLHLNLIPGRSPLGDD